MLILVISFFFIDPATTGIYTLSLHDALPIFIEHVGDAERQRRFANEIARVGRAYWVETPNRWFPVDRKSTRLNSSHITISYAVFCLKKKKRAHSRSHTENLYKRIPVLLPRVL